MTDDLTRLLGGLGALLALGLFGSIWFWSWRQFRAAWRQTADLMGLQVGSGRSMSGRRQGWRVHIKSIGSGNDQHTTLTVNDGDGKAIVKPLSLSAEPRGLSRALQGSDRVVGDPAFDEQVRIGGSFWPRVLAALPHPTRCMLRTATRDGLSVSAGTITVKGRDPSYMLHHFPAWVALMVDLADALAFPVEAIPDRLAENVRLDPVPGVRLANLEALLAHFADHPASAAGARAAIEHGDPAAQVLGLEHLGAEAQTAAVRLANDPALAPPLRARALRVVLQFAQPEEAGAYVDELGVPTSPAPLRSVVAEHVARVGSAAQLLAVLTSCADLPDAVITALAEGAQRAGAAAEPHLLALLQHPAEPVRLAAIEALGQIGDRPAIDALRALAAGLLPVGAVRTAARRALEAMELRLVAMPGALSVAPTEATGQLTAADGGEAD